MNLSPCSKALPNLLHTKQKLATQFTIKSELGCDVSSTLRATRCNALENECLSVLCLISSVEWLKKSREIKFKFVMHHRLKKEEFIPSSKNFLNELAANPKCSPKELSDK